MNAQVSFKDIRKVQFMKVKKRDPLQCDGAEVDSQEVQFGAEVLDPETKEEYKSIEDGDIWILTMLHCKYDGQLTEEY